MKSLYLCRTAPREWGLFQLDGDAFTLLGDGSLINLVASAIDRLEKSVCDFTFTSRLLDAIAENPDASDPAEIGAHLSRR